MIENILILDSETNGLEPNKGAKVIEIGALLFNIHHRQVIQTFSTLIQCDENPVQDINNIDPDWTKAPKDEVAALKFLASMSANASFIVAHNASFDKKFMDTLHINPHFSGMKWICTKNDFKWPVQLYRYRLQDICEAMGVEYINAHRALTDCTFLSDCFKKVDDLEQRFYNASQQLRNNTFSAGTVRANTDKFR